MGGHPIVTVLEGTLLLLVTLLMLRRISTSPLTRRHQFAFVAGAISFFIALSPILELAVKGATGITAVGVAFAVLLVLLYRRKIPDDAEESGSGQMPGVAP